MQTTQTNVAANIETLQSNVIAGYSNVKPTLTKENYPLIVEGQKYVYQYGILPKDKPTSPTTLKIINCKGKDISSKEKNKVAINVAAWDMIALAKLAKKSKRKSSHTANVELRKLEGLGKNSIFKVGTLFYGVLKQDIVPFNGAGETSHLLNKGRTVLIERKVSGFVCYNTNCMVYTSIDAVRNSTKPIKINRFEFTPLINKKVEFSQNGKGTIHEVSIRNVFKYVK